MSLESFITDRDRQNFEGRSEIASLQNQEREAAIAVCGPGAIAYGVWIDRDRAGILPERRTYCCRRPEYTGWMPVPPQDNERMTADMHKGYVFNGETVYPFRWSRHFSDCPSYEPVPPEKLAERRAKRQGRKLQRQLNELQSEARGSLFPEMYDDEIETVQDGIKQIESVLK